MSEPYGSWDPTVPSPAQDHRPRLNRGLVAAAAAAVVVLAVVGGTAGWILAGRGTPQVPVADRSPSVVESEASSAPAVPTEASATPTATGQPPREGFALPDLTNVDFETARKQLRERGLGVQLYFGTTGEDRSVDHTVPGAGQLVRRGNTIKVYVRGQAPMATVPGVVGLPCNQAGSIVADHGLTPRYVTGRAGNVYQQDPMPGSDTVRWNDTLRLYCGTASPSASG
jgi:hypothetical protein